MKWSLALLALVCSLQISLGAEVRLLDLEPNDAQQYIDRQDTTLKYAPKIETNVPAVRYLGRDPTRVLEDIYLANQYHGQDGLGGYLYGYSVPDIAKTERKQPGGDLRGAYNYIAGDGQEIKVEYWDDGTGFHQIDNVDRIQPKQIEDLPEVKAAKEEHLRLWQEQAERNSRPVANPFPTQQYRQGQQQFYPHTQPQQYSQSQNQNRPQLQPQPYAQAQPQQQPQYQPQQQQQQPQFPQQQQPQYQQPQPQGPQQNQPQNQPQPPVASSSNLINQYQQQKQQYPNPGQQVHYQGDQAAQYQAQQTQTSNQYQNKPSGEDDGEYRPSDEGEYRQQDNEESGPPRGFFYNFDYPVGIIVQKEGGFQKREGDLKNIYATNKAEFEKQLSGQSPNRPTRSSSGYLYIPN